MIPILKRLILGFSLLILASAVLLLSDMGQRKVSGGKMRSVAIFQYSSQSTVDDGVRGMIDGLAAYGFVAGLSEPFFLGVVAKIAGAADEGADASRPGPPAKGPPATS